MSFTECLYRAAIHFLAFFACIVIVFGSGLVIYLVLEKRKPFMAALTVLATITLAILSDAMMLYFR